MGTLNLIHCLKNKATSLILKISIISNISQWELGNSSFKNPIHNEGQTFMPDMTTLPIDAITFAPYPVI